MPQQAALFLCLAFIAWLYWRDRKQRPMTSLGLWVSLIWIAIIGTRPVSMWLGQGAQVEDTATYIDGSPLDRNVFLILIAAALIVLIRRKVSWTSIIASNVWLFAFLLYCLVSVFWSDYSFVSFKRWTKDLGNVFMILILLSETDPVQAVKAVFARFTYIAIPISILFVKYFPQMGRYYSNYTWTVSYGGITTNKNTLGTVLVLCGLFLVWDLIELAARPGKEKKGLTYTLDIALLAMEIWLLAIAKSSTAIVCFGMGTAFLLFMRTSFAKRQSRLLGTYTAVTALLALLIYSFPEITKAIAGLVGRDTTLTGRTELWSELLKISINPLIGTGYNSFWLGTRGERIWAMFAYHPIQAHNGYLETYLNLGILGVCLLTTMIFFAGARLKKDLVHGNSLGVLRFAFLAVVVFNNWTEAMFYDLSLAGIMLLIAVIHYPAPVKSEAAQVHPAFLNMHKRVDYPVPTAFPEKIQHEHAYIDSHTRL